MPIYTTRTRPYITIRREGWFTWRVKIWLEGTGAVTRYPEIEFLAVTRWGAIRRGLRRARRLEPIEMRVT